MCHIGAKVSTSWDSWNVTVYFENYDKTRLSRACVCVWGGWGWCGFHPLWVFVSQSWTLFCVLSWISLTCHHMHICMPSPCSPSPHSDCVCVSVCVSVSTVIVYVSVFISICFLHFEGGEHYAVAISLVLHCICTFLFAWEVSFLACSWALGLSGALLKPASSNYPHSDLLPFTTNQRQTCNFFLRKLEK